MDRGVESHQELAPLGVRDGARAREREPRVRRTSTATLSERIRRAVAAIIVRRHSDGRMVEEYLRWRGLSWTASDERGG